MGLRLRSNLDSLYAPIQAPSPLYPTATKGILDKPKEWYEDVKEEVGDFYQGIFDIGQGVGQGLGNLWGEISDEAAAKYRNWVKENMIDKGGDFLEDVADTGEKIWDEGGNVLEDIWGGYWGVWDDILGGAKDMVGGGGGGAGGAGINQIPLNPILQEVIDKARGEQIASLDKLGEITKGDLGILNRKAIERQQLQRELGLVPKETALTRAELTATSGIEDARRSLRERIAQKGLGSSSIGFAQERSLGREQNRLFEDIKAQRSGLAKERELGKRAVDLSADELLRERRLADVQRRAGIAGGILQQPGVQPGVTIEGGSEPGLLSSLLPIGGALIGGYMGGSGGATVGYGAGQTLGGYLDTRDIPARRRGVV